MLTTILLGLITTGGSCAASAAPLAATIAPDVIPRGWHGVDVRRDVDSEVLRERCCVQYAIKKGETLAVIAKRHLGGVQRMQELLDLNPDLEPRKLTIGQRIWLPARDAKAPERFVFLTQTRRMHKPKGYAIGDRVYSKWGEYAFVIVGAEHVAELRKTKGWDKVIAMQHDKKLQTLTGKSVSGLVRDGSPVRRIVETVRIGCDKDGTYRIEREVTRFGADDKPIKKDAKLGDGGQQWLLLVGLGGAGLVWRRRRAGGDRRAVATT